MNKEQALHYIKVIRDNSAIFQKAIREALDYVIDDMEKW